MYACGMARVLGEGVELGVLGEGMTETGVGSIRVKMGEREEKGEEKGEEEEKKEKKKKTTTKSNAADGVPLRLAYGPMLRTRIWSSSRP